MDRGAAAPRHRSRAPVARAKEAGTAEEGRRAHRAQARLQSLPPRSAPAPWLRGGRRRCRPCLPRALAAAGASPPLRTKQCRRLLACQPQSQEGRGPRYRRRGERAGSRSTPDCPSSSLRQRAGLRSGFATDSGLAPVQKPLGAPGPVPRTCPSPAPPDSPDPWRPRPHPGCRSPSGTPRAWSAARSNMPRAEAR